MKYAYTLVGLIIFAVLFTVGMSAQNQVSSDSVVFRAGDGGVGGGRDRSGGGGTHGRDGRSGDSGVRGRLDGGIGAGGGRQSMSDGTKGRD